MPVSYFEQVHEAPQEQPGPMGYGVDTMTPAAIDAAERIATERMEATYEERVLPRTRQTSQNDSAVLKQIESWQRSLGIEEGYDLSLIEWMLAGEGNWLQWQAQLIGSCVGSGAMRAILTEMMWELYVHQDHELTLGDHLVGQDNLAVFAPYHYGWGRVVGGIERGGDGSFCGAQIEALMRYGMLSCDSPGLRDVVGSNDRDYPETQNTRLYRQFGSDKQLLTSFADHGKQLDLLSSVPINDGNVKTELLRNKTPYMLCGMGAFQPTSTVLPNGLVLYRQSGTWAHNMTVVGIFRVGQLWVVKIKNSWGMKAHRNGDFFVITLESFVDYLNQRNTVCRSIGQIASRPATPDHLFSAV